MATKKTDSKAKKPKAGKAAAKKAGRKAAVPKEQSASAAEGDGPVALVTLGEPFKKVTSRVVVTEQGALAIDFGKGPVLVSSMIEKNRQFVIAFAKAGVNVVPDAELLATTSGMIALLEYLQKCNSSDSVMYVSCCDDDG